MVVHHWRLREPRWRLGAVINAVGAVTTGVVLTVVVVSKFAIGAWIPAALIPVIVVGLRSIGRHYDRVRDAVKVTPEYQAQRHTHVVVVLVGSVNKGVLNALELRPVAGARPPARGLGGGRPDRAGGAHRRTGTSTTSRSSCTRSTRRTAS